MAGRAIVPEDLLRMRGVTDPQIAPDGERVAVVVTQASVESDEYSSSIWVVPTAGGPPRRFTAGPRRDHGPRWSPDGRRLAFLSDRDSKGKPQVYVMPSDGGEATRISNVENGVAGGAPVWSPDGQRLAFVARVGGWQEPKDEKERGKSRPARVITTATYKFDGEGFTHDRPTQIFVISADGGEPRQLTYGDVPAFWPAWSPDGRDVAFVSDRRPNWDDDWAADVFVVSADGGDLRRVTDTAGPVWQPMFSPDGRTIVYVGHRYPADDGRNAHLFAVSVDGGPSMCLTEPLDRPVWDFARPVWSADGEWILFVARDRAAYPLYRVRAKGAEPPALVIGGEQCIAGVSVARETGHIAFVATDPTSPAEVFVAKPDGTAARPVTELNRELKADIAPSRPERFTYRREGLQIDGWVLRPVDFDAQRRYPALLWIHGGPHREFGAYYSHELQVYAGAGYVVVYTNPRGSQGYGEAFSRACVGDWGGGDFGDIMAGVDEALRRYPFIDGDRLGVIGISYGGYMTNWTITHTTRFKAACSEGSISNIHTQFGTSDIGHIWNVGESGGGPPWENPGWYVERSPLTYVRNVETPLLLIHAEDDLRCPIDQAEQLFIALKKLRKEVTFVRFAGESHTFSAFGRPRHRLERQRIILDWFERHLTAGARAR
ncbi:MAG TPA: S9 family peptidase [Methylomirabilota bacterium]|jgi:dipeptidyl aminopeptidase/acylaminoacyl peptidase